MSCQERRLQITSLLDGALGPERLELEKHLQACPECAEFRRELQEVDDLLLAESLDLEPPPRMWRAIEARIAPRPVPWRERWGGVVELFRLPQLRHALAGLLFLAVSSAGLLYLQQDLDEELLVRAGRYQLEVAQGNPFLPPSQESSNPFLETTSDAVNPFEIAGSRK